MTLLAELLGLGWTTTVAGRPIRCFPLTLADWGDLERAAQAERETALARWLSQSATAPVNATLILESIFDQWRGRDQVSLDELWDWMHTPSGRRRWFWLATRRAEPGLTPEGAGELADQLSAAAWRRLSDEAQRHLEVALARFGPASARGPGSRTIDWAEVARHLAATSGLAPTTLGSLTLVQLAALTSDYRPTPATELVDPAEGRARRREFAERRSAWVAAVFSGAARQRAWGR